MAFRLKHKGCSNQRIDTNSPLSGVQEDLKREIFYWEISNNQVRSIEDVRTR